MAKKKFYIYLHHQIEIEADTPRKAWNLAVRKSRQLSRHPEPELAGKSLVDYILWSDDKGLIHYADRKPE